MSNNNNNKTGFFLDILDKLFKDATTGEIVFYRAILLVLLFTMGFTWYSKDELYALYKQTRFETYQEVLSVEREKKFEMTAQEQLQIAHVSSGATFSMVTSFRPRNLNYFVDIIAVEGRPPIALVNKEEIGGYPINKTSNEYMVHMSGRPFVDTKEFVYLPEDSNGEYSYMYSCPYFNMDNIYSGSISMFWKKKPVMSENKLFVICNQASRILGRIR